MHHETTPVVRQDAMRAIDEVRTGMEVYDNKGEAVGEISHVFLGAATQEQIERGDGPARNFSQPEGEDNFLVELLDRTFDGDRLPAEMVERLRQHGYVRIDSNGLFTQARAATAEQVELVTDNEVHLNVAFDQLAALP